MKFGNNADFKVVSPLLWELRPIRYFPSFKLKPSEIIPEVVSDSHLLLH